MMKTKCHSFSRITEQVTTSLFCFPSFLPPLPHLCINKGLVRMMTWEADPRWEMESACMLPQLHAECVKQVV